MLRLSEKGDVFYFLVNVNKSGIPQPLFKAILRPQDLG